LKEFFTPIVKVTKGKQQTSFYTMPEYEEWKTQTDNGKGYKIKYYKGLGTSTSKEAKEYFSSIDTHKMSYRHEGIEDDKAIDLAFNKKKADERKEWINGYVEGSLVDHSQSEVTYSDFVNKELVLFAKANVTRAIPSLMDGFKPSQRKVLFGCFKRKLKNDVKGAQLVGYVSEHAAYHHGEMSLSETIVGMAQDYIGSNNLNLLVPSGQFGTRLQGGSDHASARYIYTRLSPFTRLIFSPLDDAVLNYLVEDGQKIEPSFYVPILPMVLVNGASGIGTGWSTDIPNYDPLAIIENLRLWIGKKKMKPMRPWFRGFTGCIESIGKGSYYSWGKFWENDNGLEITELPIRKWTQDYKEFLQTMLPGAEGKSKVNIQDVREHHSEKKVHFSVKMSQEELKYSFKWKSSTRCQSFCI